MGYSIAKRGYTPKQLFKLKLTGEPVDAMRDTLAKNLEWLLDNEIFSVGPGDHYCSYRYTCLYPIRIWYHQGKAPYAQINRDWLTPGDTWVF